MPRKRVQLQRDVDQIIDSIRRKLDELDSPATEDRSELRETVRTLGQLGYDVRELVLHHLSSLIPATSASLRILEYLKLFVGHSVDGEELDVVSGISEYPRRIREWRVEHGWPITTHGTRYTLERAEPDGDEAELWRVVNDIRTSGLSAKDRMLSLFRAFPGQVITTEQLEYVADHADLRRVRELRTEKGWRIMTQKTGRPDLRPTEYVLADPEPMLVHDRTISYETTIRVLSRDGNRCQKAGCGWHPDGRRADDPRQYVETHHVEWHSEGGSNEESNLITLCNVHHDEVHKLGIRRDGFAQWRLTRMAD